MEYSALQLLNKFRPELASENVGLSFNQDDHIVYVNDVVLEQLSYQEADEVCQLHPFMLSPELQPDGQLSSTKAMLLLKKAKILGQVDFPWVHLTADKLPVNCHIHLFSTRDEEILDVDMFAVWQFNIS